MKEDKFTPAPGVTIDNALRYIEAIEEAVERDINRIPKSERALAATLVAGTMRMASDRINSFRDKMERTGDADPLSEVQKMSLHLVFRRAMEDEAKKNS